MGRRRKNLSDREGDSPLAARLRLLCERVWDGNKTRMGRDCGGVDQPTMSRVLAGRQQPSVELLEALARREDVNPRWLVCGHGEPRPASRGPDLAGGDFSPIAKTPLPDEPGNCPELLTHTSLPVATSFFSPTAYWYAVPKRHALTRSKSGGVSAGAYLLIEASPAWTREERRYRGRLCVFRLSHPARQVFGVVVDLTFDDEHTLQVKIMDDLSFPAELRRGADRPPDVQGPHVSGLVPVLFYRDDLVGVALQACRLLDQFPEF